MLSVPLALPRIRMVIAELASIYSARARVLAQPCTASGRHTVLIRWPQYLQKDVRFKRELTL